MSKSNVSQLVACVALLAVLLVGCSDDPAPTATLTPAPTNTPAPGPTVVPSDTSTPVPSPIATAAPTVVPTPTAIVTPQPTPTPTAKPDLTPPPFTFAIEEDTVWRDLFNLVTESEQTCIREALGDDLDEVLDRPWLDDDTASDVQILTCLTTEVVYAVFEANFNFIAFIAGVFIAGVAEELGPPTLSETACVRELVTGFEPSTLIAALGTDDDDVGNELLAGVLRCYPDILITGFVGDAGLAPGDLTDEERGCLADVIRATEASLLIGMMNQGADLESVAPDDVGSEFLIGVFKCYPDILITGFVGDAGLGLEDLTDDERGCLADVIRATEASLFIGMMNQDADLAAEQQWVGELSACAPALSADAVPDDSLDSLLWQYETGNHGELVIVSALADGVVYAVSYEDFIYALDAESGDLLWKFESESSDLSEPLTVAGGILYAAGARPQGAGRESFALDAYTGERLRDSEPASAGSLLSDGIRYTSVPDSDGLNVRAIDDSSGELMWEADVRRSSWLPLLFPLTASGGNVYVSDGDTVHALDSTTGKLAWSFADDTGSPIQSPPLAADGVVFLRSYSAAYALDEPTGDLLWRYEASIGQTDPDRPIVMADGIWFLAEDGRVIHALDAAAGQPLWSYEDDYVSFISGLSNGMVFVTGGGAGFYALDVVTGKEMWSLDADWHLSLVEVTVVDGVLYATSLDGYLHTFDARTGEPIWSVEIGYHVGGTKPYVVSGGVVYVGYQPRTWRAGEAEPSSGIYAFTAPAGR